MAHSPDGPGRLPDEALVRLVEELDAEILGILEAHCLTPEEAETIVFETMVAVGHRWGRLNDPKRYFLDTLERACDQTVEDDSETPS
jgi:hypothetical protein